MAPEVSNERTNANPNTNEREERERERERGLNPKPHPFALASSFEFYFFLFSCCRSQPFCLPAVYSMFCLGLGPWFYQRGFLDVGPFDCFGQPDATTTTMETFFVFLLLPSSSCSRSSRRTKEGRKTVERRGSQRPKTHS